MANQIRTWVAAYLAGMLLSPTLLAQDAADQFLEALRTRRLDGLAKYYSEQVLSAKDEPEDRQTAAAVEYSTLLVTQAGEQTDPQQRKERWDEAANVLRRLLEQTSEESSRFSIRFHLALVLYARGSWLNQLAELSDSDGSELTESRGYLNESVAILQDLLKQVQSSGTTRANIPALNIGAGERSQLLATLQHRLGVAYLAVARTLTDNEERAQALKQATQAMQDLNFAELEAPIDAASDLLETYRQTGEFARALSTVDRLRPLADTQQEKDILLAEQVDTLLAQNKTLDALAILFPELQAREDHPPRWDFLYLQVLLMQADSMRDEPEKASKLQASALLQLHKLERRKATTWVRQAELQLSKHASTLLGEDVAELRRAADIMKRAAKYEQAAQVYFKAARLCLDQENKVDALPLLHEAGRAWEQANDYESAAQAFDELVRLFPDNDAAPTASLRVVLNLSRAYEQQRTPQRLQSVTESIGRHLQQFPTDETAGEVQYVHGQLQDGQDQFPQAIASYRSVAQTHRLRPAALLQASRAYERWLKPLQFESVASLDDAVGFHREFMESAETRKQWTPAQRAELAARYARFLLDPRQRRAGDAQAALQQALANPMPADWQAATWKLLVVAFVEQGKFRDAQSQVQAQLGASVSDLFDLVVTLNRQALYMDESKQRETGFVAQQALCPILMKPEGLPKRLRDELSFAQANVATFIGTETHVRQAMQLLTELRRQNPKDARYLEITALCLMQSRRYEAAVSQWRTLLAGIPKETPMWYRAKLYLIMSLRRSGLRGDAKQALDLMEVLHPDLGGPALRDRFLQEKERLK